MDDISGVSVDLSQWANYPAISNIDANNHDLCNVGNAKFKGNITVEGTGNTLTPYWYDLKLNGNIYTGSPLYVYNPVNSQTFNGYDVYNRTWYPNSAGLTSYPLNV